MTLKELQNLHGYSTDKESTHHYLGVYDRLFAPFQDKEINLLEVGYATGGSVKLWRDYFSKANILCIDNDAKHFDYSQKDVYLFEIDINNEDLKILCPVNIAIDDGSHFVSDQIAFIKFVWPVMKKGSLMIIEDVFDIENSKKDFDALNIPYEIIDLRKESGVSDSVLLIFTK